MKVQTVSFNTAKPLYRTSFKGSPLAFVSGTIQKQCSSDILSKFLRNASKWGEKETIILNGAGKTLLAPLIILFNPFIGNVPPYKKENKAYMALKQPVNALVNSAVQLGVFFGVDKGLDYLFKKGALAENFSNLKHLNVLKSRASLALALVTMPVACALGSVIYSKAAKTFLKGKNHD